MFPRIVPDSLVSDYSKMMDNVCAMALSHLHLQGAQKTDIFQGRVWSVCAFSD